MKTVMKGGVWKNSEDEILKAAVMKYGLNNWSRVASLLVRKSAKQCKSRWYEWLDPSVKKTEWTREEEEKLLHLAKLFPNQWRTIAPIVGRTAHQCLEHYDRLLDQAQGRVEEDRANDPRRLRPGEIDPHPETKPGRADVVDMDDDEKEMLAEARARLANTRGKKAKRKAREKQLEEARRLTALQKRRELKAAGIAVGRWRRRNDAIDYAVEVPFEQQPPKGFYKVGPEEAPAAIKGFGNILLQELEGTRRIDENRRLRKEDSRKLKRIMEENIDQAKQMIEKMNQFQNVRKKTKLVLPEVQLNEDDLKEIVLLGKTQLLSADSIAPTGPSDFLLETAPTATPLGPASVNLKTPMRTPAVQDAVMLAAKDAVARTMVETPLEGGKNPEISNFSFGNTIQTQRAIPQTPNVFASSSTMIRSATASIVGTPFVLTTPTPLETSSETVDPKELKARVLDSLKQLPSPQNELEIDVPDVEDVDMEESSNTLEEDAEVILQREELEKQKFAKRNSQVLQKNLPRPLYLDHMQIDSSCYFDIEEDSDNLEYIKRAEQLIQKEQRNLILNEAMTHPQKEQKLTINYEVQPDDITVTLMEQAALLVNEELSKSEIDLSAIPEDESIWSVPEYVYSETASAFVTFEELDSKEKVETRKKKFNYLTERIEKMAKKNRKLEQKYAVHINGYIQKMNEIKHTIEASWNQILNLGYELDAYKELEKCEAAAFISRRDYLQNILNAEKARELELQKIYNDLVFEYNERTQNPNMSVTA